MWEDFPSPPPPGVDIDKNIKDTSDRTFDITQPYWWYNNVKNNGRWDYKQINPLYQDFGNFNYGATGVDLPLPGFILKRGAGWASTTADPDRGKDWGQWYNWGGSYGDDPADQELIRKGIDYCGCR